MADLVTRRVIEIDAKIAQGALANLKSMDQSVASLEKTIGKGATAIKQFAIGFASAFTVGALVTGIKASIDHMDELNKEIQKVGIEAEAFQKLQYAADLADVSSEQLNKSIVKLSVNLQDVDTATTDAAKALRSMGVRGGDSPEQALNKIADAFQKMPDGARKTALAVEALGKGAQDLIPLLNQGAEGLKAMGDEAEALGIIISGQALAAAEEFNDTISKIQKVGGGAFAQVAQGMLPALQALGTALLDVVNTGETFVSIGQGIGDAALFITKAFIGAAAVVEAFGKALAGLVAADMAILRGEFKQVPGILKDALSDISKTADTAGARINKLTADYEAAKRKLAEPIKTPNRPTGGGDGGAAASNAANALRDSLAGLARQAAETQRALVFIGEGMPIEKAKALADALDKIEKQKGKALTGAEYTKAVNDLSAALDKAASAQGLMNDAIQREKDLREGEAAHLRELQAINEKIEADRVAALDAEQAMLEEIAEQNKLIALGAIERQAAEAQSLEALQQRIDELIDPTKELRAEMDKIREAMVAGKVDFNEGARALEVLSGSLDHANDKAKDLSTTFADTLLDAINGFSRQASEAIVDFAMGVEGSFENMVTGVLRQLAVMTTQALIVLPLFNALKASMGIASAQGNVFDAGGLVPFARGGIVNRPTVFPFANGVGLMGEAGPEAIMPLTRTAGGDLGVKAEGAGVNVVVINNAAGATATAKEERRPDGGVDVRILVEDTVERGFATGRFDQTLSQNYGVARRGRN